MSTNDTPFKRQFFGYRRKAVDEHLAVIDASIADLREAVDRAAEPEHQELVLRATRLAVEEILQRAHDDAAQIRSGAEAEAARILADAYDIAAAREAVIDLRPEVDLADAVAEPVPAAPLSDDGAWQADLADAIDD